jgi:hypothetical protein
MPLPGSAPVADIALALNASRLPAIRVDTIRRTLDIVIV